jgi:2,3-bisphosphoglycerate-dependent phosphoglycerate mutase
MICYQPISRLSSLLKEIDDMVFYLVRHAHAEWSPDEDRPLSMRGSRDALIVADILDPYQIEGVISSPYARAVQTVEPLARRMNLRIDERVEFRERELGAWTAETFEQAVTRTWDNLDFAYPMGETNREAQKRGVQGIQELLDVGAESPIVIGTHGNLLALILNHFNRKMGYSFWSSLTMPDIYRLVVRDQGEVEIKRMWE